MLVSYKNLILLRIIPGGFPNTIIQKCREVTGIEPREMLLEEYPKTAEHAGKQQANEDDREDNKIYISGQLG